MNEPPPRGDLFVISAPSGTGKTTLILRLLTSELAQRGSLAHSTSHTTRGPRPGEVDGRHYHFVDRAVFRSMVEEDRFLEWAEYNGNDYGTSRDEIFPRLERGIDVVLDIEVKGAEQVMAKCPDAQSIFLLPPGLAALESRLRGRGSDGPEEMSGRLAVSRWEIERYVNYDYVIINDDLQRASDALAAIILEKRQRLRRMAPRVREILRQFEE